jgi:hypothetical protein
MPGQSGEFGWAEGFLAGALAMVTFHQPAAGILHALGAYPVAPFDLAPRPSGLPALVQGMLWSGGWGVLFLLLRRLRPGTPLLPGALLYCALVPVGFLFLVLAPLAGAPIAWGLPAWLALCVVLAHAAWGFGIALWLVGMRGLRGTGL